MSFDAAEAGTPVSAWQEAGYRASLPPLDTGPLRRLIVVAAHPDDETLMAGGLIAHAAGRGLPVTVVVATSGEASHPHSPTWTGPALAAEREREVAAALDRLAPDARLVLLRMPDGALAEQETELVSALLSEVAAEDTVVSTWRGDQHPDHSAVARAAAAVASRRRAVHLEAPIWLWHWGEPGIARLPEAVRFDLDEPALAAKRDAIALHATQVEPLSPAAGDEVLLRPEALAHFLLDSEVVFPTSAALPVDFDGMYATADDPWGFDDRWYEQRKRALLLAALPRPRFARVLEIGCSSGTTTSALADRADALVATDVASRAVEQARARLRDRPGVRVEQRRLPDEWPDAWGAEPFDLIVLSEVGFYLAGTDLDEVVDLSRAALAPGGVFVACHWRPHVLGLDRGGDAVHRVIRERFGGRRLVEHVEDDFVLEVFQTEPSASVAAATGLR
ncbi:MAG: bifunctional PIG-L family deacetylase/class I SAM-dependent methyltransferase [Acidobacteria bacterium]|nr:bifunctional PIG-L family deacetylase/class I SAM-dependent methyltransferase [Acidobacteriota bacterium]